MTSKHSPEAPPQAALREFSHWVLEAFLQHSEIQVLVGARIKTRR